MTAGGCGPTARSRCHTNTSPVSRYCARPNHTSTAGGSDNSNTRRRRMEEEEEQRWMEEDGEEEEGGAATSGCVAMCGTGRKRMCRLRGCWQ